MDSAAVIDADSVIASVPVITVVDRLLVPVIVCVVVIVVVETDASPITGRLPTLKTTTLPASTQPVLLSPVRTANHRLSAERP